MRYQQENAHHRPYYVPGRTDGQRFKEYGWDADSHVHKIYSGKDKNTDKEVIISTWQSIYKFPKRYFDDIDCVIGDEAHLFKSKSLTGIMTKLHNAK